MSRKTTPQTEAIEAILYLVGDLVRGEEQVRGTKKRAVDRKVLYWFVQYRTIIFDMYQCGRFKRDTLELLGVTSSACSLPRAKPSSSRSCKRASS